MIPEFGRFGWAILVGIGLSATLTFVIMYAVKAPTWHRSLMGRTLMAKATVLSALLSLVLVRNIFRNDLPEWIWVGGMATLDLVLWFQVFLLWRANQEKART